MCHRLTDWDEDVSYRDFRTLVSGSIRHHGDSLLLDSKSNELRYMKSIDFFLVINRSFANRTFVANQRTTASAAMYQSGS